MLCSLWMSVVPNQRNITSLGACDIFMVVGTSKQFTKLKSLPTLSWQFQKGVLQAQFKWFSIKRSVSISERFSFPEPQNVSNGRQDPYKMHTKMFGPNSKLCVSDSFKVSQSTTPIVAEKWNQQVTVFNNSVLKDAAAIMACLIQRRSGSLAQHVPISLELLSMSP